MNCWLAPLAMLGLTGVIAIETRLTHDTLSVVDPDEFPYFAVIFDEPQFFPLAYALPELDTFEIPAG